jgi:hypothetical protein
MCWLRCRVRVLLVHPPSRAKSYLRRRRSRRKKCLRCPENARRGSTNKALTRCSPERAGKCSRWEILRMFVEGAELPTIYHKNMRRISHLSHVEQPSQGQRAARHGRRREHRRLRGPVQRRAAGAAGLHQPRARAAAEAIRQGRPGGVLRCFVSCAQAFGRPGRPRLACVQRANAAYSAASASATRPIRSIGSSSFNGKLRLPLGPR